VAQTMFVRARQHLLDRRRADFLLLIWSRSALGSCRLQQLSKGSRRLSCEKMRPVFTHPLLEMNRQAHSELFEFGKQ